VITWVEALQILGPSIAVYAAIRADIAVMKAKVARAELDIQSLLENSK
jgi:hypothetical protein